MAREYIKNVNWGFWGVELKPWQAIQRLVVAGFHDPRVLQNMFAIIEGESGSYTKAWHANVFRDEDETISRFNQDGTPWSGEGTPFMKIKSIDLGFIQRNVLLPTPVLVAMTEEAAKVFVDGMFNKYPQLGDPVRAAEIAHDLWTQRGYKPWFGYKPDTPAFKLKKKIAAKAIAEYLIITQVGKIDGKLPKLVWAE